MIEQIALTRWVPLVQVKAIDGDVVETAKRLERPKVAGVLRRRIPEE